MSTSKKLRELQASKAETVTSARALLDKADAEKRELSAEEATAFDALQSKIDGYQASIDREIKLVEQEKTIDPRAAGRVTQHLNLDDDPKRGFKSFGEFARATIMAADSGRGYRDDRLLFEAAAPSTYGNESSGVDGGFLVPPEFSKEVWSYSLGEDSLLPLTENQETASNSMAFPKDETTPWGTDGIRAYWQAEATAATATKPVLGTNLLRLYKLMAMVPVTDELMSDTNTLNTYIPKKVGLSIRWKTNEAILLGTGVGQPKGALTGSGSDSAMLIVAKDSGQSSNTLTTLNIANMIARLPPGSYGRSIWQINNDVLPALFTLTLGNYPIYLPIGAGQGGIVSSPFIGVLMGRPVIISQHANTFSSQGDVQLLDLSYYRTLTKAGGGLETATSMHLYFDADALAFRVTYRIDGQPIISSPITPAKGSNKLSPFLQLASR